MITAIQDSVPIRFVSSDGEYNISGYIGKAQVTDMQKFEKSHETTSLFGFDKLDDGYIWAILDGYGGAYDLGIFFIACSRGDGKLYMYDRELDIPVGSLVFDNYYCSN